MVANDVGSILAFCYSQTKIVTVYLDQIPEGFERPSMYFPPPSVEDEPFTPAAYQNSYSLYVKIFGENAQDAYQAASKVAERVKAGRYLIPTVGMDGNLTGRWMKIDSCSYRIIDFEDAVAQITFDWTSRQMYDFAAVEKIRQVITNITL